MNAGRAVDFLLRGRLTAACLGAAGVMLACWAPHYLTWPWWTDADVHGTAAQGWSQGLLPYRDLRNNNFPGIIYLFWGAGRLFGWGDTAALYALDALVLVGLGAALAAWGRRALGRALPGAVAFLAAVYFYLSQDFTQVAQKDWYTAVLCVLGLVGLQAAPGRWGVAASAAGLAAAAVIRPQAILFAPAHLAAVLGRLPEGSGLGRAARAAAGWALLTAGLTVLAFAPVWAGGLSGDLLGGLAHVRYGSGYNRLTPMVFLRRLVGQFGAGDLRALKSTLVAVGSLALLTPAAPPALRRAARPWLVAWAGAVLYLPVAPVVHMYLDYPLRLVSSVLLGLLGQLAVEARDRAPRLALLGVLVVVVLAAHKPPRYCLPRRSAEALADLRLGRMSAEAPPGFAPQTMAGVWHPPWPDYRDLILYLRRTDPGVRVANLLKAVAVTAPSGRLPSLPAESVTWLRVVNPGDEGAFVDALGRADARSLVVWAPAVDSQDVAVALPELDRAVRRLYEPEARFGAVEVWKRKGVSPPAPAHRD